MSSWAQALVPYAEFSRVGFVNILAFRLRYFTGIIRIFSTSRCTTLFGGGVQQRPVDRGV